MSSCFPGLLNLDVFLENLLCSNFWNHFPAKIILLSPLFLDSLIAFSILWKNQVSWESWLVRFEVNRHSKMQKNFTKFFLSFSIAIMDLLITLKYWILLFLRKFQPTKYYLSRISTLWNMNLNKLWN